MLFHYITYYNKGRVFVSSTSYQNYYVVSSQKTTCENTPYTAYGIAWEGTNGSSTCIEDVSCEDELVAKMVEMFNVCRLDPRRLTDAVLALLP